MDNINGSQSFGIRLDTAALKRDIDTAKGDFKKLSSSVVAEGGKMDEALTKVRNAAAAFFTLTMAKEFVSQVAKVRGEFQQLEIAFKTMLGSASQADALMSQLIKTAATTPFGMSDIANSAKQLLAYGVAAEDVNETLVRLGDIAAGLSIPIGDLAYLYGTTMTQGKVFTQDLRQFMGRGIPLADELAKQFGVTKDKVGELVTAGKVGFPEVKKAIWDLTDAGSKFGGLMEAQSKTITGQISNIEDSIEQMFNNIGKQSEGIISGTLGVVSSLVENYKQVGVVLAELIAVYGTYKAAVIAVTAVQAAQTEVLKGYTLAQQLSYKWSLLCEKAQSLLNKTMLNNPYVLAATAIAALAVVMYNLVTHLTDAEKATKRLNDAASDCSREFESERVQIDILFGKLDAAKKGTKAYEEAKSDIINQYGSYLNGLSAEIQALEDVAGAYKAITEAAREAAQARALEKVTKEAADDNAEKIGGIKSDIEKLLTDKFGERKGTEYYWKLVPVIEGREKLNKELKSIVSQFDEEMPVIGYSNGTGKLSSTITNELRDKLSDATNANVLLQKSLSDAEKKFGKAPQEEGKSEEQKQETVKNKKYYEDLVKDLTQQYENLTEAERLSKAGKDLYNQIIENQKKVKGWDVSSTLSSASKVESEKTKLGNEAAERKKAISDYDREVSKAVAEAELDIRQAQIDNLDDGFEKQKRQIQLNYDKLIAENKAREQKMLEELRDTKVTEWKNNNPKATKAQELAYRDSLNVSSADLTSEQQGMLIAYEQAANEYLKKANETALKDILEDYLTYEQKRSKIAEDYAKKRADLISAGASQENIAELNKQEQQALQQLFSGESATFKESINWESVFGDLAEQAVPVLQRTLAQVRQYFEANKDAMGTEEIKYYQEAIAKLEDEIANRNPFAAFLKSINDIKKGKDEYKDALQEMADKEAELNAAKEEAHNAEVEYEEIMAQVRDGSREAGTEAEKDALEKKTKALEKVRQKTEQYNKSQNKVNTTQNKVTKSYKQFTNSLRNVGGVISSVGKDAKGLADIFDDKVGEEIGKCVDLFDTLISSAGDVIDAIGDTTKDVSKGIEDTANASGEAMKVTAQASAEAISTVEKASVILAVISAALRIAMAIANLFNNDASHQKEIEALQERIDQLQWELDNADIVRMNARTEESLTRVRRAYNEAMKASVEMHTAEFKAIRQSATGLVDYIKKLRTLKQNILEDATRQSVARLADEFSKLGYSIDKALGEEKFASSKEQLENLAEQQVLIQRQINEENSKKNTDNEKIVEWERKIEELGHQMVEVINNMVEEIIGGSSDDIAKQLGDAFFDAFAAGEDAAEAWGKKVDSIVADILKRMMIQKFLEEPLGDIFDKYKAKWFKNGEFQGIDAITSSMESFRNDLNSTYDIFSDVLNNIPADLHEVLVDSDAQREAAEAGIAQASQESVDELNGRATAIQGHTFSIMENTKLLLATANSILESVLHIEDNTEGLSTRMRNVEGDIHEVKNTVNDIALRGIKIK